MRAAVTLIVALTCTWPQANATPSLEVESLIKQALEDRLAANDIPDGILLGRARIAVLQKMPRTGTTLTDRALPQRDGFEFYLLSNQDAQSEADRTGRNVSFIVVDQPAITGDTATLAIGVDFVAPRESKVVKACCCTGFGQFKQVAGKWTFLKWAKMICA